MDRKLFSKNYIFTVLSATFFYGASFMLNAVCSPYIVSIGGSRKEAGIAVFAFTISSCITRPVWGYFADKKGRRYVYISGAVLCTISSFIIAFSPDFVLLILSRMIFGVGYSAITTSVATVIYDVSGKENISKAITYYGFASILSQAIAPGIALWIFDSGFVYVGILNLVVMFASLVSFMFVKYDDKQFISKNTKFKIYSENALNGAYIILFFAISVSAVYAFVPLLAQERNIEHSGLFFTISAVFLLISRLLNVYFQDNITNISIFYASSSIFLMGFVILAFARSISFLLFSAVLFGIGSGFIHPIANIESVKNSNKYTRGLANSTFMMSQDLGMAIGSVLWGTVSEEYGFTIVYLISAFVVAIMMYVFKKVIK